MSSLFAAAQSQQERVLIVRSYENKAGICSNFDESLRVAPQPDGTAASNIYVAFLNLARFPTPGNAEELKNILYLQLSLKKFDSVFQISITPARALQILPGFGKDLLLPGSFVLYQDSTASENHLPEIIYVVLLAAAAAVLTAFLILHHKKRMRAEAGLEESEARYLAFVANSSEGVSRFEANTPMPLSLSEDEQVKYIFEHAYLAECNEAFARMYGVPNPKGIVGVRLADLLMPSNPQNREFLRAFVRSRYRLRDHVTHEQDPEGNTHWFENGVTGIIEGDRLVRAWVAQREITDRMRAEEALHASEELNRVTFDQAGVGIAHVGTDGRLLRVNDKFCAIVGYSHEELTQLTFQDITYPEELEQSLSYLQQLLSGEINNFSMEKRYVRRDGSVVWVDVTVVRSWAHTGEPGHFISVVEDITDRKTAERALEEYKEAVENSVDLMFVVDREYRHVLANRTILEMSGLTREQVIGHTVSEVVGEDFFQRVAKPRLDECFAGRLVHFESEYPSPRLGARSFVVSFYPIQGSQGIDRVCGVVHDITDRKRAEADITDQLRFESLLAELSSRFVRVPVEQIDEEVSNALRRVCETLGLEMGTVWRQSGVAAGHITLTNAYGPARVPPDLEPLNCDELFPWCSRKVKEGEVVAISSMEELQPEAARDRESWHQFGIKSNLTFGLAVGGSSIVGALSFSSMQAECAWPEPLVKRLKVVAQMFSNALGRLDAEMALRTSEERFRSLVENATVGIYRTTPEGRILAANPTLVNLLGYEDFESMGARNLEQEGFEPTYPRKEFRERIERVGEVIGLEAAWRKRDSSVIFVRESARGIRGNNGEILYYDGIVEDITERMLAEEVLRRRAAFDELMTGILSRFATCAPADVDDAIVKALQAIAEFVGADHAYVVRFSEDRSTWSAAHEWCGESLRPRLSQFQSVPFGTIPRTENMLLAGEVVRINSPDDYPPESVIERRHREREGHLAALNVPLRTKAGILGNIGLHSHARPLTWSDDDVVRLRMVGDAVATALERKQAFEELRKSEEIFSTAFHASPVAMTIVSLATGRYLKVNRAFEEMTGIPARDIIGRAPQDFGRPAGTKEEVRGLETQYRTRSGEIRTWSLSTEPIEFGGEACSLRAGEDITERKRGEQRLRELGRRLLMAQETERRNVALELHDDFSQRLALLAIDLEKLAERPPARKDKLRERLKAMRSQTEELTSDIHRLSRQLHPSRLEDLGLVGAVRSYCREISRHADLEVKFSSGGVPRDLPKEISLCVYRIVQEALGNVVKHSGVNTAEVELGGGPDEVQLVVSDPGKGFAMEDAQAGEGLGLVSMQERVRYVGGSWSVDASPSEGTRVVVRIPVPSQRPIQEMAQTSGAVGSSESPIEGGSRTRVLLADDHTLLLEAVKGLLEPEFEVVGTAPDGRAALAAVEKLKPELVVLDIGMPLLNGLDAARQIRAISPNVKVIFMTMNPDPDVAREAMRLGASGYLLKTSAASELRNAIREAVRGLKYVTPGIEGNQEDLFTEGSPT